MHSSVRHDVRQFVIDNFLYGQTGELADHSSFLEAGIIEPLLFGTKTEIKPLDAVGMAVDVLFRAYAPSGARAT